MKKISSILIKCIFLISLAFFFFPQLRLVKLTVNQYYLQQWQLLEGFIHFQEQERVISGIHPIQAIGDVVARIEFLDHSLVILEGIEDKQLEQGLGHDPISSLPGSIGNCLIYGHREQYLWPLKDLKVGDQLTIQSVSGVFHYTVDNISIRYPNDPFIFESDDESVLTLVTCYPFIYFGPTKERYVVKATLN